MANASRTVWPGGTLTGRSAGANRQPSGPEIASVPWYGAAPAFRSSTCSSGRVEGGTVSVSTRSSTASPAAAPPASNNAMQARR